MLQPEDEAPATVAMSEMNAGALPMVSGVSRLEARFCGDREAVKAVMSPRPTSSRLPDRPKQRSGSGPILQCSGNPRA